MARKASGRINATMHNRSITDWHRSWGKSKHRPTPARCLIGEVSGAGLRLRLVVRRIGNFAGQQKEKLPWTRANCAFFPPLNWRR